MKVPVGFVLSVLTLSAVVVAAPTPQPDDGEMFRNRASVGLDDPTTGVPDKISCGDHSNRWLCKLY